jgi:hypothetical protein
VFDRRANLEFNPKIKERELKGALRFSTKQRINSWLAKIIPYELPQ